MGTAAEWAVILEATRLGIDVYRPVGEGGRYDMLFDLGSTFVRVQCKWASLYNDVVVVRCYSSRRNRDGLVRRKYARGEVDAFAAYCDELRQCFFLAHELCIDRSELRLRVHPSKNNQFRGINWASDFDFAARLSASKGP